MHHRLQQAEQKKGGEQGDLDERPETLLRHRLRGQADRDRGENR